MSYVAILPESPSILVTRSRECTASGALWLFVRSHIYAIRPSVHISRRHIPKHRWFVVVSRRFDRIYQLRWFVVCSNCLRKSWFKSSQALNLCFPNSQRFWRHIVLRMPVEQEPECPTCLQKRLMNYKHPLFSISNCQQIFVPSAAEAGAVSDDEARRICDKFTHYPHLDAPILLREPQKHELAIAIRGIVLQRFGDTP